MPKRIKEEEQAIWGTIKAKKDSDGIVRKHFFPNSSRFMKTVFSRFSEGKRIGMIPVTEELSFSQAQRAYHFVLINFISHETGNTKDDEHDDAMKEVFGIRTYKNSYGIWREGRYSISDASSLKLPDIQKLIDRDLATCSFLGIVVPTFEELGYIRN